MVNKKKVAKNSVGDILTHRIDNNSPFLYVEAYNHLRTNVMFSLAAVSGKNKTIVVSSAFPEECKSTVSSNLAISMAKLQKKVLLIDADLRKPKLHMIFGLQNKCGLSNILLDSSVDKAIVGIGGLNLDFLPAGAIPPNPSELLGSKVMADLIAEFEKIYDYIIIDTPPVLVVSDALTLSGVAAGVLLSCKYKKTSYNNISKAVSAFEMAKFPILGTAIVGTKDVSDRLYNYSVSHR